AAATTGPAHAPLPASSTPTTTLCFRLVGFPFSFRVTGCFFWLWLCFNWLLCSCCFISCLLLFLIFLYWSRSFNLFLSFGSGCFFTGFHSFSFMSCFYSLSNILSGWFLSFFSLHQDFVPVFLICLSVLHLQGLTSQVS